MGETVSRSEQASEQSVVSLPHDIMEKYELISTIGKGAFGTVYKVKEKRTQIVYAMKQMAYIENNRKEVEIQGGLNDDHVVRIYDAIYLLSEKQLFVVMEFCEGGNLMQWIKRIRKHKMMNELLVLHMFHELCKAVYSCHLKKIIHRDLKPENVLLDHRRRLKLADFGVARILDKASVAKSFCGTPPYMAPELFLSYMGMNGGSTVGYDEKCDVWSVGCILWDMANSKELFVYQLDTSLGYSAAQAKNISGSQELHHFIEDDIPMEYVLTKQFLHQMLKKNPSERISLSELLQSGDLAARLENPINGHWSDTLLS